MSPCGFTPRRGTGLEDVDPAARVIANWIIAREAGDVAAAASCCHESFLFASPNKRDSISGLADAKTRLFTQQAPVPVKILAPLQLKEDTAGNNRPIYFREVSFKVPTPNMGTQILDIRQEWMIIHGDTPLIGSLAATRVKR